MALVGGSVLLPAATGGGSLLAAAPGVGTLFQSLSPALSRVHDHTAELAQCVFNFVTRTCLEHFWVPVTNHALRAQEGSGPSEVGTGWVGRQDGERVRQGQAEGAKCKPVHHKLLLVVDSSPRFLVIVGF